MKRNNFSVLFFFVCILGGSEALSENKSKYDFYNLTDLVRIPAHGKVNIDVRTIEKMRKYKLQFEVLNALTAPQTHPIVNIIVRAKQ